MHSLFSITGTQGQGIMSVPAWQYVKDGLTRNLATVVKYYRRHPRAVNSSHFLIRLLQSINVPQIQNLERYYNNVDAMSLNLSMALNMSSSIFKGHIFNGIFYGKGNSEILIAHNESFNPFTEHDDWENIQAIKVLRHAKSDLDLNLPDGTVTSAENGLCVIAINIPLLAVQYRAFRLNEIAITEGEEESQRSIMQFIHMYVLPNMLFSHIDQAIFNRFNNLYIGAPLGESDKGHPFYLTDYSDKLVYVHNTILNNLNKVTKDFTGTLQSIPALVKENMEEVMALPEMAMTRQVIWGIVISRLPMLTLLFKLAKNGAGQRNMSEVNRIRRSILGYRSDNLMRSMLPLELYYEVEDAFTEIYEFDK